MGRKREGRKLGRLLQVILANSIYFSSMRQQRLERAVEQCKSISKAMSACCSKYREGHDTQTDKVMQCNAMQCNAMQCNAMQRDHMLCSEHTAEHGRSSIMQTFQHVLHHRASSVQVSPGRAENTRASSARCMRALPLASRPAGGSGTCVRLCAASVMWAHLCCTPSPALQMHRHISQHLKLCPAHVWTCGRSCIVMTGQAKAFLRRDAAVVNKREFQQLGNALASWVPDLSLTALASALQAYSQQWVDYVVQPLALSSWTQHWARAR